MPLRAVTGSEYAVPSPEAGENGHARMFGEVSPATTSAEPSGDHDAASTSPAGSVAGLATFDP
jgi:hypothetical protein